MSKAKIFYHDIGDYLSREEKLNIVQKFGSMANMPWQEITPNEHGDWISMRNESFDTFIPIESEKKFDTNSNSFFITSSLGLGTNRDSFCYNSSIRIMTEKMTESIRFYNVQRENYQTLRIESPELKVENVLEYDSTKLNWTDSVIRDLTKNIEYQFKKESISIGSYRPFFRQRLYFSKELNHRTYQQLRLFPTKDSQNLVIVLSGVGVNKDFSLLMTDVVPDLQMMPNGQCFPLYFYEENTSSQKGLFDEEGAGDYIRRDAVSDFILNRAQQQYKTKDISKEDIFYYVYGFLHSKSYRETFANDLKKMLPRLPLVEDVRDFWAFSKAGRQLADLHLNYETQGVGENIVVTVDGKEYLGFEGRDLGFGIQDLGVNNPNPESKFPNPESLFKVEKMRFPTGLKAKDRPSTIHYNNRITINNIPPQAYDYIVNGKSAIEWIMERYAITTHKDSGITNDPNDWAEEVGNPRYVLDLLLSVVEVSVRSVEVVEGLPGVEFE